MGEGAEPVVCGWEGDLFKGVATPFDEATERLRSPCFLATGRPEAIHYASTLPGDDADRRLLAYRANRPLRLVRLDAGSDWEAVMARVGVKTGSPVAMARALLGEGYDGLMLDDGLGEYHVVLGSSDVVDHAWTEPLAPAPSP